MQYVYLLQSVTHPRQTYCGSTADLKRRLVKHNEGVNKHTRKFRPWKLVWFCVFTTKQRASAFEHYLKTASGIAFRRKRLL